MSRAGEIRLDWAGEPERLFRLGIGQVRKIQEATGLGPTGIAARTMISMGVLKAIRDGDIETLSRLDPVKTAEIGEVREVHLQGLLGAGVPGPEALKLVRDWVEERPLAESLPSAYAIAMAAVLGPEDEGLGETTGEGTTATPFPTESGASPNSTAPEPSSA